jgi:FkbM family methyltransferase
MNHFFDVGANIGQTFDDFLVKQTAFDGWCIWCFEPSPRHVPALMEKAASVSSRYRVFVCPFGLRGNGAVMNFFQKDDARGDSFESFLASDHLTQNLRPGFELCVYAAGITDMILGATKPGDKIVLKLDCEGSEYDLLGALIRNAQALERVARILVEWHTIRPGGSLEQQNDLIRQYSAIGKPLEQWMF